MVEQQRENRRPDSSVIGRLPQAGNSRPIGCCRWVLNGLLNSMWLETGETSLAQLMATQHLWRLTLSDQATPITGDTQC